MRAFIFTILFLSTANALDLPQSFNFEGQLLDNLSNPITVPTAVKFQVYNPAANCLIYEEDHAAITPDAGGYFAVGIGSGVRSGNDPGLAFKTIFQNNAQVRSAGANCAGGYTPAAGDGRKVRVTVAGNVLSPDYNLAAVPMASVAESLQGKVVTDFAASNNAAVTGFLSLPNQGLLKLGDTSANYVSLRAPASVTSFTYTFPFVAPSAGQVLSSDAAGNMSWITPSSAPTGAAAGDLTGSYPSPTVAKIQGYAVQNVAPASGDILKWNSTNVRWEPTAAGGGGITSLNGQTGTAQTFAVGTSGLSPAYSSGSDIHTLNIPMASTASVSAGLISNSEFNNFVGKLSTTGGTMSGNIAMGGNSITGLAAPSGVNDAATKAYVDAVSGLPVAGGTMSGNISMGMTYKLTNTADPSSPQDAATKNYTDTNFIKKDGTSGLTANWNIGAYDLMNVGNIIQPTSKYVGLSVMTDGQESTMTTGWTPAYKGRIWYNSDQSSLRYWNGSSVNSVGGGSLGGDVTGAMGTNTVQGLQGRAISGTAPAMNEVYVYNGSAWVPQPMNDGSKVAKAGDTLTGSLMFGFNGSPSNPVMKLNDADTGFFSPAVNAIGFSTSGAEQMRIDPAGNVGVGTTAPAGKLHVMGDTILDGPVQVGPSPTQLIQMELFDTRTCSSGTINPASVGTCTITGLAGVNLGGPPFSMVVCNPNNPLPLGITYSCSVEAAGQVRINIRNDSGSGYATGSYWHIVHYKLQ